MFYNFIVCFLFYNFISPSLAAQNTDLRNIGEFTGGEYSYRDRNLPVASTISEGVEPYDCSAGDCTFGAPLSEVYNDWPEKIDNHGIFPYLLKERSSNSFCSFVQNTYKSSCAVIGYTDDDVPFVIGSGGYIDGNLLGFDGGVVATARHNFNGRDLKRLYVRFYNYEVSKDENSEFLQVKEDYIDVPVIETRNATNGLDAGILRLYNMSGELCQKYTKMITPTIDGYADRFATMPEGKYALFHFASGHHLISVGHINAPPMGAWMNSNIGIEGGDGASGSMFLQENFGQLQLGAHGVSIYRHVEDGCTWRRPERRAIPFARFFELPRTLTDLIAAPYANNPNFKVPVTSTVFSDGYEFLRWRDCSHIGRRHDHPVDPMYNLDDLINMSNHHIIPIDHLIWLWEYVHNGRLDEETTTTIKDSVDIDDVKKQFRKVNAEDEELAFIDKAYKDEYKRRFKAHCKYIIDQNLQEEVKTRYESLKQLINILTPTGVQDQNLFSWAWWNLFKGPNSRSDDPASDGTGDYSEKQKPLSFDQSLWSAVKKLDTSIKELKKASQSSKSKDIITAEKKTEVVLKNLYDVWIKKEQIIHPYTEDDWSWVRKAAGGQFTNKNGHEKRRERKDVYALKK